MNAAVSHRFRFVRFAVLLTAAVLTLAPPAGAQEAETSGSDTVRLVAVKYADVNEVLGTIMRLGLADGSMRVSADERSNALIVIASDADFERVNALVALVDKPAAQKAAASMRVVALKHASAESVAVTLSNLLSDPRRADSVRVALDTRSNAIVLSGGVFDITQAAKIVEQLDLPAADAPVAGGEMLVRIAWLVGDEQAGKGARLPEGLDEVAKELEYFGVGAMRLATQTVVRVTSGEQFRTRFVAELGQAWRVELQGLAVAKDGGARTVDIELEAIEESTREAVAGSTQARRTMGRNTELRTTISTVSGHFVVLGLTPIGSMDSAFVIQIIDG